MASEITELAHLQISLQKILDATNNFSDKNIIGKGDFGKVYRGKLEHKGKMIEIAARRLDRKYGHGNAEFWTEVSTLASFQGNPYIVAMIGFCDEKDEKIVINHHYPKGSLSQYISDLLTLDVLDRFEIATSLCLALHIIHGMDRSDYYIIHRNINSSTILLDKKLKLWLSGFEFSIKHSKERRNQVAISEAIGTQGYIDPAIEKYGGVNHKSDIYSVGVVLFELLCGRKAFEENTLLAPLAKFHYENGTLKDIIDLDFDYRKLPKTFKYFSKAAYSCLQEDPTLRPDAEKLCSEMMKVTKALIEEVEELTSWPMFGHISSTDLDLSKEEAEDSIFQNVVDRSSPELDLSKLTQDQMQMQKHSIFENVSDRSSPDFNLWKVKKWEHLRFKLSHIPSPPPLLIRFEKFSPYASYHGLVTFKQYVSFEEQKNTNELSKRCCDVMVKMAENKGGEYPEDVFLREREIVDSCRHPNIQSFLGFYDNGHTRILFYEYFPSTSLLIRLWDDNLTWGKSLKICIDVAEGLDYLHNGMEDQKMVIHGSLHIGNIVFNDILGAKIVGFENSVIFHSNQSDNSIQLNETIPYVHYMDPEYAKTHKLKRESDVFSFGVVMLQILSMRFAIGLMNQQEEDVLSFMRKWIDEGIIKKELATGIMEENYGNNFFLNKGPNEDSLDTFINIASKCLAKSQNQRPEIKVVVKELYKALSLHVNHKDPLRMSFNDIKLATQDFANCIGGGGFGRVYKGKIAQGKVNGHSTIVVKKLDTSQGQGEKEYYNELRILYEYKHENVISLIGYSDETDEKLIVYEHASKGSLDKHLNNASLTWRDRLEICIDVATGLDFLHEYRQPEAFNLWNFSTSKCSQGQGAVCIHRDIKTANILLFDDWKAKVGDFGLSLITTINKETKFTIDHPCGTKEYVDPMYLQSSILTIESDVYSFGVALFEILYGRTMYKIPKVKSQSLLSFIKYNFDNGKQDELVFKPINQAIVPESLTTFLNIVYKCLDDDREKRPTIKEVLAQLEKALKFQDEDKI